MIQELKYWLHDNECRGVFIEAESDENGNGEISEKTVQFLVKKLIDFIDVKFPSYKWDEIECVCDSAVAIFPLIKKVLKCI